MQDLAKVTVEISLPGMTSECLKVVRTLLTPAVGIFLGASWYRCSLCIVHYSKLESLREFEDLIILAMLTGCFNKQSIWLWKNHIDVIDSSLFPDMENGNSWIGKVRVHVQHYPDYKHWFINIKSNHICKVHSISDIIFCWSIFLVLGPKNVPLVANLCNQRQREQ